MMLGSQIQMGAPKQLGERGKERLQTEPVLQPRQLRNQFRWCRRWERKPEENDTGGAKKPEHLGARELPRHRELNG